MKDFRPPAKTLDARFPSGEDGHEQDWIRACKGGKPASSNFDYSGPLSEMVLMGNLAVRFPNRKLLWDGAAMKVTTTPKPMPTCGARTGRAGLCRRLQGVGGFVCRRLADPRRVEHACLIASRRLPLGRRRLDVAVAHVDEAVRRLDD